MKNKNFAAALLDGKYSEQEKIKAYCALINDKAVEAMKQFSRFGHNEFTHEVEEGILRFCNSMLEDLAPDLAEKYELSVYKVPDFKDLMAPWKVMVTHKLKPGQHSQLSLDDIMEAKGVEDEILVENLSDIYQTLTWNEVEEVSFEHLSTRENMIRINTQRILNDITRNIERAVASVGKEEGLEDTINKFRNILESQRNNQSITHYEMEVLETEENVNVQILVHPRMNIDRVNISVALSPA